MELINKRGGASIVTQAATAVAVLLVVGDNPTHRDIAAGIFAVLLIIGAAIWCWAAIRDRTDQRHQDDIAHLAGPASAQQLADTQAVVDRCLALDDNRAAELQARYSAAWTPDYEAAAEDARDIAFISGRMTADEYLPAPYADLCYIVGGGAEVAIAVLVRDLIPVEDFALLTGWWSAAGEPLTANRVIHKPVALS